MLEYLCHSVLFFCSCIFGNVKAHDVKCQGGCTLGRHAVVKANARLGNMQLVYYSREITKTHVEALYFIMALV